MIDDYIHANDDFLFVSSAGNRGRNNTDKSIGSECSMKNGICVGASNSYGPNVKEYMASPDFVTHFSSKGPTQDGRIKPDIIAPGLYVLSAGAQPNVTGECDPDDPEDVDFIRATTSTMGVGGLASKAGTSMAVPTISGSLLLIRQYFKEGFYPSGERRLEDSMEPSGALLKAVLLNGGVNLTAVDNSNDVRIDNYPSEPYDGIQGFGRVSLENSLYIKGESNLIATVYDREVIKEGETNSYSVLIHHSDLCQSKTLSVTLTWMDLASPSTGCPEKCLINDLDLYITKNHDKYFPNGLDKRDEQNTVERVRIEDAEQDDVYNIHINAINLDDENKTQQYALVFTGCFPPTSYAPSSTPTTEPTMQTTTSPTSKEVSQPIKKKKKKSKAKKKKKKLPKKKKSKQNKKKQPKKKKKEPKKRKQTKKKNKKRKF